MNYNKKSGDSRNRSIIGYRVSRIDRKCLSIRHRLASSQSKRFTGYKTTPYINCNCDWSSRFCDIVYDINYSNDTLKLDA